MSVMRFISRQAAPVSSESVRPESLRRLMCRFSCLKNLALKMLLLVKS